jgi:hypothetical protein
LIAILLLPVCALPVRAQQAEAKDVARQSNCPPGKIEVLRQTRGAIGETVFKVACAGKDKDAFVLVQCQLRQCILLH